MAISNVKDVLRVPGKLCIGPTNLDLDFPHGGTELGLIKAITADVNIGQEFVIAEEFGSLEPVESVYYGELWVIAGILRTWDIDGTAKVFPNVAAGSSTGKPVVSYPGTNVIGRLEAQDGVKLCFSPLDLTANPMLLMFNAVPMRDEALKIQMNLAERAEFGIAFVGLRDATGRIVEWGFKDDLTL